MKRLFCLIFLLFYLQSLKAQFACPDSLIYGISCDGSGPNAFIRVYDPRLPLSPNNPSLTNIPTAGSSNDCRGLALLNNLNNGQPSPTLYSTMRVGTGTLSNAYYCYWNGSGWVNTWTLVPQLWNYVNYSIAGCNDALFSMAWTPGPNGPQSNYKTIYANYATGTGLGPAAPLFTVSFNAYEDIVTDCNCNIYLLFPDGLRKYDQGGNLLAFYQAYGPNLSQSSGSGFSIVGNIIYSSLGTTLTYSAAITGNSYSFAPVSNLIFASSDWASCPFSTTVSTQASVNSGTISCNPSTVNLAVTATLSPLNYYWSGPGIGTSVPGSSVMNVNAPGIYTCTITQDNCDYKLATVVSTVVSNTTVVTPQVLQGNALCLQPFMNLTASLSAGSYSYQWNGPAIVSGANTPTITLNGTGIYSLTTTDLSNGCSGSVASSILPVPLLSLGISTPTLCVHSSDGKNKAVLDYSGASQYTLLVSPGFSLQFLPGQPVVLFQTPPYPGAGAPGSATIIGSNGVCTGSAITNFSVLPVTTITAMPGNTNVCNGTTLQLKASGAGSYTWFPAEELSFVTEQIVRTTVTNSMTIFVQGTDQYGCLTATTTVQVGVFPPHEGELEYKNPVCAGECADFVFTPKNPGANKIYSSWSIGNSKYRASSFKTCFSAGGIYPIKGILTDSINACSNPVDYSITVNPKPEADFSFQPARPVENMDEVYFYDASQGDRLNTRNWHVLDTKELQAGKESFSHLFSSAGLYPVALTVRNEWNCADTMVKTLKIEEDFLFYIPNTFTPNDDGKNDVFVPVTRGVSKYSFSIFDRWGTQVFNTNQTETGWDGSFKGQICPQGVYTWKINLSTKSGTTKNYAGHVMVVR